MPRRPMSLRGRMRIAAAKLGISFETYQENIERGLKWCVACQDWQPRTEFGVRNSASDRLHNICNEVNRARARAGMRRLREQRWAS